MTNEFIHEERYIVFKISDVVEHLTTTEAIHLARLYEIQRVGRKEAGKAELECVVVEKDWPEYEPTWKAIEARVTGEHPVQRFVGRFGTKEMEPAMQDALMKFDPATGEERPYPSHATQWRNWHGIAAWLFDPWTGRRRNAYDVGSDVHGLLIAPAGTLGMDMGGGCSTTTEGVMKRQLEESK